ncbi:MAG: rhomboid family intramembrane serine protease [Bacteroidia bacterium]
MSYGNEYRPGGFNFLPPVTKNILIINVIFFLLTIVSEKSFDLDLYQYLGLHYHLAPDFRPHQFITYLFMHGNFGHIFFNMFGVFIFGQVLEQVWGAKRFIIFYILTGFGAAIAQYFVIYFSSAEVLGMIENVQSNLTLENFEALVGTAEFQSKIPYEFGLEYNSFVNTYNAAVNENPTKAISLASQFLVDFRNTYLNSQVVVGASGSLFGLLGAFGMLFPNQLLYLYFFIPVKAKWLVIGYGLIELISGITNNSGDNVAHFAHLGGLFVGIFLILLWRKRSNSY